MYKLYQQQKGYVDVPTRDVLVGAVVDQQEKKAICAWLILGKKYGSEGSKPRVTTMVDGKKYLIPYHQVIARKQVQNAPILQQVLVGEGIELAKTLFLKEGKDASKEVLKSIKNLPIPYKEEWMEFFLKHLQGEGLIKELEIIGSTPYQKALKLDIDFESEGSRERLERALAKAQGEYEFIKKAGRAPRIGELLMILDVDAFNIKKWLNFLKQIGTSPQTFSEDLSPNERLAAVYVYEIFEEKAADAWKRLKFAVGDIHNLSLKKAASQAKRNKPLKKRWTKMILDIASLPSREMAGAKHLVLQRVIEEISEEILSAYEKGGIEELLKKFYTSNYKDIHPAAVKLAMKAGSLMLSERSYKEYEREYVSRLDDMMTAPRRYPTVSGKVGKYEWECMDFVNPDAWFVGLETNCCQHLGSTGRSCVLYGADNPETSGIFKVSRDRKTIAQSWFWIVDGVFCFDNIEVLGKEVRESIWNCYMDFIENHLAPRAKLFEIEKVTVGLGYNDATSVLREYPELRSTEIVIPENVYTDARTQVLIKEL